MEWLIATIIAVTVIYIYGYFQQKKPLDKEKLIIDNLERYAFKYCQSPEYFSNEELLILREEYEQYYFHKFYKLK